MTLFNITAVLGLRSCSCFFPYETSDFASVRSVIELDSLLSDRLLKGESEFAYA